MRLPPRLPAWLIGLGRGASRCLSTKQICGTAKRPVRRFLSATAVSLAWAVAGLPDRPGPKIRRTPGLYLCRPALRLTDAPGAEMGDGCGPLRGQTTHPRVAGGRPFFCGPFSARPAFAPPKSAGPTSPATHSRGIRRRDGDSVAAVERRWTMGAKISGKSLARQEWTRQIIPAAAIDAGLERRPAESRFPSLTASYHSVRLSEIAGASRLNTPPRRTTPSSSTETRPAGRRCRRLSSRRLPSPACRTASPVRR